MILSGKCCHSLKIVMQTGNRAPGSRFFEAVCYRNKNAFKYHRVCLFHVCALHPCTTWCTERRGPLHLPGDAHLLMAFWSPFCLLIMFLPSFNYVPSFFSHLQLQRTSGKDNHCFWEGWYQHSSVCTWAAVQQLQSAWENLCSETPWRCFLPSIYFGQCWGRLGSPLWDVLLYFNKSILKCFSQLLMDSCFRHINRYSAKGVQLV